MKFNHDFSLQSQTAVQRIYTCGDTVAQLDFVSESCVRVALYRQGETLLPTFCIDPENTLSPCGRERLATEGFPLYAPTVQTENGRECFTLGNGITVTLEMHNFLLSSAKNGKPLHADRAPLAYNFAGEFGRNTIHYLTRETDERIFGAGDKGGDLNKAGRSFAVETSDPMGYNAATSDPLYKHIPFFICENNGGVYGIFYDTAERSQLDFGREINNYYAPYKYFKTEDTALVYYLFFGSKLSVLQQFTALCGRQAFPPKWSFDYCASTMAYTDAEKSEEKMNAFLEKVKALDLPCRGFYLSSGYTSIGAMRYVFHWNREKFPDPKAFIERFADNGICIIPNIKPAFLDTHPLYQTLAARGCFLQNPDGTPFVTQFWDGLGSYLDFTKPEAFAFWQEQVTEQLLDNGVTATWNDNNEFDVKDCEALADGFGSGTVAAHRIRSTLTYLMVLSSYRAQMQKAPEKRPFLSTRSGGIGVRRLAQTWSGDNRTAFEDLRYCHNIGLTMSLSGLYFYGHDLGGFAGDMPSRELLLRWLQHGIFEPRFTIHSWNADGSATMPWSYEDILPAVKALFAQRRRLLPYLYNAAYQAVEQELPLNAPVFLYYDDEKLPTESNAFMVGRDILAACIFDEGESETAVYLPKGDDWYLGDTLYRGGDTVPLTIPPTAAMPYFVRAGSVLPLNEAPSGFNQNEQTVLHIYPLQEGQFEAFYFDDDGESFAYQNNDCVKLTMTVTCTADKVTVTCRHDGKQKTTPPIVLAGGDTRQLEIIE